MQSKKRYDAAMMLTSAVEAIAEGPDKTPAELTRKFLEALTIFASTMTGNTSVVANNDASEFMYIYNK